ncbi:MAG TPA: hypothetical protein VM307_01545 [Egibacteraceae bacterium]|nr:hypothetical protein [Egibacteraceae bacterium]
MQHGVRHFVEEQGWHLTLRGLVDQLVKDAPSLRSLFEAAAVVRQFDEPTSAGTDPLPRRPG